jgi:subtilisin family serine protease
VLCFLLGTLTFVFETVAAPAGPPGRFRKLIVLRDQADVAGLDREFTASGLPVSVQHRRIVSQLQEIADRTQPDVIAVLNDLQAQGLVDEFTPFFIANCIAVEATSEALSQIEQLPQVLRIEDNYPIEINPEPSEHVPAPSLDDPVAEIGLRNIRAPEVWAMGITGASVLVSHLDTGVNGTHPALAGKWRGNFGYPASACWLDLNGSTTFPTDNNGHGSRTMGVICGMATPDTIGVAWGARYISARLNQSSGQTLVSTALTAFQWMLNPDGDPNTFDDVPRVISNSWGFAAGSIAPCYSIFNTAMDNCEAAGSVVLWAAGNEGPSAGTMRVPADRVTSALSSFSVGAFDYVTNSVWSASSRGPSQCSSDPELRIKPELVAPGRNVRSSSLGSTYVTESGTSYSVAHVAGVIALMLEANPELSVDSLKEILLLTAADKGVAGEDNSYGWGQVDALTAVYGALSGIGWVSGYVTDPLGNGISVNITPVGHPHKFVSDSTGHYVLAMPADLPLDLVFGTSIHVPDTQSVMLMAQDTLSLDVVLVPNGNGLLTGTVVACTGMPAVGALVYTIPFGLGETTTDEDGRFELALLGGVYSIGANDGYCAPAVVNGVQILGGGITDIEIVLPSNPAYLCSPPDNFGYQVCDNNDPGGPAYEWTEIAPGLGGHGIVHNLSDDGSVRISLPFPVRFYGNNYEQMYINGNGNVSFRNGIFYYINQALPFNFAPAVFALWDDLNDVMGGDICSTYDPGHGRFIVEWSAVPRYDGVSSETFQIVLYNTEYRSTPSGDAVIEVEYNNVPVTNECTVGVDADNGNNGLQYVYNGTYANTASPLAAGRALRFSTGSAPNGLGHLSLINPSILLDIPPGQWRDTALVLTNSGTAQLAYHVELDSDPGATVYEWLDSRNPGGPAYQFFNIAQIGTDVGAIGDDSTTLPIRLPWFFPFYDRQFDRVAVCSNGFISFTSGVDEYLNEALSDPDDPFYYIAPFWDDLWPCGGHILTYSDTVGQRFIVQWDNVKKFSASCGTAPGPYTFQVDLYHDGTMELVYGIMGSYSFFRNSATVGMRGRNATGAIQLAFNSAFIENNRLIRIRHPQSAAAICRVWNGSSGVIAPAETLAVPVRLWNNELWFGSQEWALNIQSSDEQTGLSVASVVLEYAVDSFDAHLTIRRATDGVQLNWERADAPYYCVYTSSSSGEMQFVTAVTDTFCALTYGPSTVQLFEIRLCEGPPGRPAAMPGPQAQAAIQRSE